MILDKDKTEKITLHLEHLLKFNVVTLRSGNWHMLENTHYIFEPKVRRALDIQDDEILAGFMYLTDLEVEPTKAKRKNKNLITKFE